MVTQVRRLPPPSLVPGPSQRFLSGRHCGTPRAPSPQRLDTTCAPRLGFLSNLRLHNLLSLYPEHDRYQQQRAQNKPTGREDCAGGNKGSGEKGGGGPARGGEEEGEGEGAEATAGGGRESDTSGAFQKLVGVVVRSMFFLMGHAW